MKSDGHPEFQQTTIRTTKIIAGALIVGPTVFLAVTAAIGASKQPGSPMWGYMGAGVAVMMIVMFTVTPSLIAKTMIRRIQGGNYRKAQPNDQDVVALPKDATPADLLHFVFMLKTIIGFSFVEGAVFLNTFAYLASSRWWSAAIAAALIAILATLFPTESRVRHWVDDQLQLLDLQK